MVTIVDYGMGNLGSVENAFKYLGEEVTITTDKELILNSKVIVLPGVGAIKDAMKKLEALDLIEVLKLVIAQNKPFLGVCLGLQMLFEYSEEGGEQIPGLGVFKGAIKGFKDMGALKVPHMGWNNVDVNENKGPNYFSDIPKSSKFYFVHSYYLDAQDKDIVLGTTEYGIKFDCMIQKNNLIATQFHPEKSGEVGMKLLSNFIQISKEMGRS